MKISTSSGVLEIPQDLDFEIKANHPFFSDEGTASIPVTIPATAPNCAILGYPERVERATRFVREIPGIAECGVFRKQCRIISESASRKSGISMCLALTESEMYAAVRDIKLKEALAGYSHGPSKMTPADPFQAYHSLHLDGFGYSGIDFPFALFPVASDLDSNGNCFILNKPGTDAMYAPARTLTINDKSIQVPEGYAIAPYIYLWAMIEYAFEASGFGIGANCFKTDEDLQLLVVVHNRADVSVESYGTDGMMWGFHYADLVPDMTIGELIVWLHDKFGAVVVHNSGGVYIYLLRDLLTNTPDYDLTPLAITDETISYPAPSTIERSTDTSIESAQPAADSLEALREQFANCIESNSMPDSSLGSGLHYIRPLGKYYHVASGSTDIVLLGSATFPYKRKGDLKAETISTDDPFLPTVCIDGVYMPYIGKRTHLYTDTGEEAPEQKIQICYAFDVLDADGIYTMAGSSFSFDHKGAEVTKRKRQPDGSIALTPHPALTPEGLAPFWSDYEKMLMNGAPEISLECEFPMADLVTIDMMTPKLFKGVRVLIRSITYKVKDAPTTRAKMTLQLIPDYTDMQIPASIHFGRNLTWKVVSTRYIFAGNGYTIDQTDGLDDYNAADDRPDYTPRYAGIITKRRKRWLKYTYTKKVKKWWGSSTSTYSSTHEWDEYFISVASE